MTMPISEKNFLERLASHVPGLAGYREREGRRETDRRLREFLATRLDEGRAGLNDARNRATKDRDMAALDAIGRVDRTLQKAVAGLRYADHGYSGVFDQLKIGETELSAIYAYDGALVSEVVALADRLRAAQAADIGDIEKGASALELKIARRREVLEKPQNI
jgi:capsule polysaccharide export protein KpsE/RkpR